MSNLHIKNDATSSALGMVYQIYVAVEKCFELCAGQKVLIETLGDVTIPGLEQIEVKRSDRPLTDNHLNLWKTLSNWMQEGFDDTHYSALILYTTQSIGKNSAFADWNVNTLDERLTTLKDIYNKAEQKFNEKHEANKKMCMPESLQFQKRVLDPKQSDKLNRIIAKCHIEYASPDLSDLHQNLRDRYCKSILRGKQLDFLNELLGFVIGPESTSPPSWEITFEAFDAKVKELTPLYCIETRIFPQKFLRASQVDSDHIGDQSEDPDFVKKIRDIQYEEVIPRAIQDHTAAKRTILEEFRLYEVPQEEHESFAREVLDVFVPRHRVASRNMVDAIRDAQTFYDTTIAEEPPKFPGFESTPRTFRNGVLHIHMDATEKNIRWRLGQQ